MRREATRVLVTGGAGFIGSHLVRALVAAGHSVRVLDDLSTGTRARLTGLAVELLQADVRNPAAMRRALDGAEVIFHLAGLRAPAPAPLSGDPDAGSVASDVLRAEEVNVFGTLNLLLAAREQRPHRVILASSGSVYGRVHAYLLHEEVTPLPATPDAVQRLAIEHYARVYHEAYRVPTVVLRLFRAFGPGESWEAAPLALVPMLCRAALTDASPLIVGDGRQTRDLLYVDNVVAALLAAASVPTVDGQVLNIASGEAVSVAHLWALICELAGRRRDAPAPTFAPSPPWEPPHVRVSIARAARALGYAPAVRLREGLRRTLDHYRATHFPERSPAEHSWFSPPEPVPSTPSHSPRSLESSTAWPRPSHSVPPPPPPVPTRVLPRLPPGPPPGPPVPPPRPREVELTAADITEVVEADAPDLDVAWAPVPGPWGVR